MGFHMKKMKGITGFTNDNGKSIHVGDLLPYSLNNGYGYIVCSKRKGLKKGSLVTINGVLYQVVRFYNRGKLDKWGLLNLKNFTIGFTDSDLNFVIQTYESCP
jgi:hypothetical protein